MLDSISEAILDAVDGARSVDEISETLAAAYSAPLDVIRPDTDAFLSELAAKRLVEFRDG
jgi:pyrroloquinoline quinone biosynthesis protein D